MVAIGSAIYLIIGFVVVTYFLSGLGVKSGSVQWHHVKHFFGEMFDGTDRGFIVLYLALIVFWFPVIVFLAVRYAFWWMFLRGRNGY